jgi:signal transduction histidine kinase
VRSFASSMSAQDTSFARLVSLACHDLRTPLATVYGFARTLIRSDQLGDPAARYVEMIEAASQQLGELLDELALAARIEVGRYEPTLKQANTADLARTAQAHLDEERVGIGGPGGTVWVDLEPTERAVAALTRCALRHGGLERVEVRANGAELTVEPITAASAPVVLGEDLRDLGAAVAVRVIRRLGGSVSLDGETLRIELPTEEPAAST